MTLRATFSADFPIAKRWRKWSWHMNHIWLIFISVRLIAVGVGILAYVISKRPAPQQSALAERAAAIRVITARNVGLAPQVIGYDLVAPARDCPSAISRA